MNFWLFAFSPQVLAPYEQELRRQTVGAIQGWAGMAHTARAGWGVISVVGRAVRKQLIPESRVGGTDEVKPRHCPHRRFQAGEAEQEGERKNTKETVAT